MKSLFTPVLLSLSAFVLILACNNGSSSVESDEAAKIQLSTICDNEEVIGQWTMCSNLSGGIQIQYNVCPIIYINDNGTGMVVTDSGKPEKFTWIFKGGKLIINYTEFIANSTFSNTAYISSINQTDEGYDLTIRTNKSDIVYYLSK